MANGRRVAFVPPAGAVQEFKVADRELRRRGRPHRRRDGERHAQERHQRAQGRELLLPTVGRIAVGDRLLRQQERTARSRSSTTSAPAASLGGPVRLPGLFDGHDRTFFFGAVEWLYDTLPRAAVRRRCRRRRCATATSRRCSRRASSSTIRRPRSGRERRASSGRPFPGNIIPTNRLNPIAQKVLSYYPQPNQPGDASGREQLLLRQPANGRLLLHLHARRPSTHRQAAASSCATRGTIGASRATRSSAT